ncbi:hypothetical protein C7534_101399 [Pseudomonas sp. OV226]|jgi:hypothetical protein|nr:hypothetical protein C7534_101399 [Pseudomonas sp. OV226]
MTVEIALMSILKNSIKQSVAAGSCIGTIGSGVPFNAGLVELSEGTFPLPHGEAHVMFARQRAPSPDYSTKEIKLSFSKGLAAGRYNLTRGASEARITYLDNTNPDNPVIYTQNAGTAQLEYENGVFSGEVSVLVENNDDDQPRTLNILITFSASRNTVRSNRRRAALVAA